MSTRSCWRIARRGTGWRQLVKRRRRLTGAEVDELVDLYQRVSTHLSMVRSFVDRFGAHRPVVGPGGTGPLGSDRCARAAVERVHPVLDGVVPGCRLPVVAVVGGDGRGVLLRHTVIAMWVSGNPEVQAAIGTPTEIDELVNNDFASYYSENPAGSFALQVWVNNSWMAAQCIGFADPAGDTDSLCALSECGQPRM